MKPIELTDNDYENAAKELLCDVALIKAFASVESSGNGFIEFSETDWRPKILFEAYWFSNLTNHQYDKDYPDISSSVWNPKLYCYGKAEYERLDKACTLNREAGLQASSWGKFQIMGFNYKICGFVKLQDFINAMYKDEVEHLKAFVNFIKSKSVLWEALKNNDFEKMALYYNGSKQVPIYSERIKIAYNSFKTT